MTDDERIDDVYRSMRDALRACYGEQEPLHVASMIGWQMGGPDPLDGISVFRHPSGHWHYVGAPVTPPVASGAWSRIPSCAR